MTYSPTATQAWKICSNLPGRPVPNGFPICLLIIPTAQRRCQWTVVSYTWISQKPGQRKDLAGTAGTGRAIPLEQHRTAMFSGEAINTTENRAVLHAALRAEIGDQKVAAAAEESDQRVALVKEQLAHKTGQ